MVSVATTKAEIVIRTTEIRLQHGLEPLTADRQLALAAQAHAESMARGPGLSRYAHEVDGRGPGARATDAGYRWCMIAENIAWSKGQRPEQLAESFVTGWWNSPPHRENILQPRLADIGVGLAQGAGGEWFAVQKFGLKAAAIGREYAALKRLLTQGQTAGPGTRTATVPPARPGELREQIYYCHHCGQPHAYDGKRIQASGGQPGPCFACGQQLRLPFRIRLGKRRIVLLNHDTQLFPSHLDPTAARDQGPPIAEVSQHPTNPAILGLKNLSTRNWWLTTADGTRREVPPGRSARLAHGVTIDFGGVEGEIRL